jgi:hypothetical protein
VDQLLADRPAVFLLAQRQIVEGVAGTGLK